MKEHPIIFSGEMVRAILDGRKTQTRRVIKPQPQHSQIHDYKGIRLYDGEHRLWWWKEHWWEFLLDNPGEREELAAFCPHGVPGDQLYLKETAWLGPQKARVEYAADMGQAAVDAAKAGGAKFRSSLFMARWMSRINLQITNIRVERVQDIREDDAIAEGFWNDTAEDMHQFCVEMMGADPGDRSAARAHFFIAWEKLNRKRGYGLESNPWVWVVEFEVMK